jgi:hypothetical protein
MRIRVQLFTLMRIRNRFETLLLIRINGSILSLYSSWILTSMLIRMRIQLFTLMRILTQLPKVMRLQIRKPDSEDEEASDVEILLHVEGF